VRVAHTQIAGKSESGTYRGRKKQGERKSKRAKEEKKERKRRKRLALEITD
jgi:hypothetical protein